MRAAVAWKSKLDPVGLLTTTTHEFVGRLEIVSCVDSSIAIAGPPLEVKPPPPTFCFLVWFADNLCALNVNELVHEYDEIIKDTVKYTGLIVVRKRRHEETGRVVLDSAKSINHHSSTVSSIKQFIEKGITELENPEAVGIYLFNNGIFGYLHDISEKTHGFNLSHDLLANVINMGGKLYSYAIGDEVDWVDVESPSYSDRNKEIIMKITTQMGVEDMPLRKNNT